MGHESLATSAGYGGSSIWHVLTAWFRTERQTAHIRRRRRSCTAAQSTRPNVANAATQLRIIGLLRVI